nr:subtilisin-like protease SBT1.5 [Ipomoea trifida]
MGFLPKYLRWKLKRWSLCRGFLRLFWTPEQVRHLETTRSPEFLGLTRTDSAGLLKESDFGSDLVIGVLDNGIWQERKSFKGEDLPGTSSTTNNFF